MGKDAHSQTHSPQSGTSARVCKGGSGTSKEDREAFDAKRASSLCANKPSTPSENFSEPSVDIGQEQLRHAVPLLVHLEATQNAAEINHTIPQIPITVKGPPRLVLPIVSALKQRVGRGGTSTTDFVIFHHQAGNQTFLCLSTISRGYIIYY